MARERVVVKMLLKVWNTFMNGPSHGDETFLINSVAYCRYKLGRNIRTVEIKRGVWTTVALGGLQPRPAIIQVKALKSSQWNRAASYKFYIPMLKKGVYLSVRGWEGILLPRDGKSKESGFLSILRHAWMLRNLNICTLPFKHTWSESDGGGENINITR